MGPSGRHRSRSGTGRLSCCHAVQDNRNIEARGLSPPCATTGEEVMVTLNHANWSPHMLSILRIMTGPLFMEHGTQKLLGFPPAANPGPALFSLLGVQGILELAGGLLIVLGLFTRPMAFILAGDMAVAYFMAHAPRAI